MVYIHSGKVFTMKLVEHKNYLFSRERVHEQTDEQLEEKGKKIKYTILDDVGRCYVKSRHR